MNVLQFSVKNNMRKLQHLISQIPINKQIKAEQSVQGIIKKNIDNIQDDEGLQKLNQQLENKYNFYKLSYPNIQIDQEIEDNKKELTKDEEFELNLSFYLPQNGRCKLDIKDNENNVDDKNDNDNKQVMIDGKLVKGQGEEREKVDISNWFAANVDPEDLRRHRELLDRQHYRGPYWEGKKVISTLESGMDWAKGDPEELKDRTDPNFKKKSEEESYESVKR